MHHKNEIIHCDEILDIVDQNDQVIRSMPRAQVYKNNLCAQMRAVWLIIRNEQGQLWIPRRSWKLQQLPGHLDGSVVGHVRSGESYEQALLREAIEEIGQDISHISYRYLGKLTPQEHNTFCFSAVFECIMSQAPENWNRDEICEWQWMTPQELLQRCQGDEKFKDTLPIIIQHFYPEKK